MKISTKGRYGLRAMVDLGLNSSGDQVTLNSIAERQNVSENYLEQVFSILRKAGLVKSIKGAQGGYVLGDDPARITVGDILRALEGNLFDVDEPSAEAKSGANLEGLLAEKVWSRISDSINSVVDAIKLEELMNEYKKLNDHTSAMYYI